MKKTDEQWKKTLPPKSYVVCRCSATEAPFTGEYWDCHDQGVYHCIACEQPLFRSEDKFDSGTGWPSFTRPIEPKNVILKADRTLDMERVEVLCSHCESHLGHVFDDGPKPTGKRFCINSAALKLLPV